MGGAWILGKRFSGLHALASERLAEDSHQGKVSGVRRRRRIRLEDPPMGSHGRVGAHQADEDGHVVMAGTERWSRCVTEADVGDTRDTQRWRRYGRRQTAAAVRAPLERLRCSGKQAFRNSPVIGGTNTNPSATKNTARSSATASSDWAGHFPPVATPTPKPHAENSNATERNPNSGQAVVAALIEFNDAEDQQTRLHGDRERLTAIAPAGGWCDCTAGLPYSGTKPNV